MAVEGLGTTDVFNIRDDASPVKIGSFVYPTNEWNDRTVQDALRHAWSTPLAMNHFQVASLSG